MARQLKRGRLNWFLVVLLATAITLAGLVWERTQRFANHPLVLTEQAPVLVVDRGDGFDDVLKKMRALGIAQGSDLEWKLLATQLKVAAHLQVGDYAITPGMTPHNLLTRLRKGEVIQHKFTIVEGWNFRELRENLARNPQLEHGINTLSDTEIMAKLGRYNVFPEGRFLPETYHYTRGASDLFILNRAAHAMDKALAQAWQSREKNLPLNSPTQLLTLASIIEKETGQARERPQISGVFIRRLQLGMRLQTDPTVIYGIGSAYDGNIRRHDLLTDTPYNTYTRAGLPPTPIAMPGQQALQAAAHPAADSALYFVARGNGAHYFSVTLDEHNAAVRKYQLKQ